MRSRAVGFQGRAQSRPKPAGTQIRATGVDSRITPKQEDSHAIQACYFGPRGSLIVRGDGDRVGTDATGPGGFERRQRRTGRSRHRDQDEISQDEISPDEVQKDEVRHDDRNECRRQEGRSS